MCNLLEALDYEEEHIVIEGFMERYNVTKEEAQDIFTETKKWLWLAAKTMDSDKPNLFIDKPLVIIDEMWHNFILHTKYYYDYCMTKFNRLIHHFPTPHSERLKLEEDFKKNPQTIKALYEHAVKRQYGLIYDHLGSETLLKWYETIGKKYTTEYIAAIKKY